VAPKPELMRLASVPMGPTRRLTAMLDRAATMPGRGAYVCIAESGAEGPSLQCMKLATRKGALQRAFRQAVEVPGELLESHTKVTQPDTSPAGRNGDASQRRVSTGFGRAPRYLIDR